MDFKIQENAKELITSPGSRGLGEVGEVPVRTEKKVNWENEPI